MSRDYRTLYQHLYTVTDVMALFVVLLGAYSLVTGSFDISPTYQLFLFWSLGIWFLLTILIRYYYHTRKGSRFSVRIYSTSKLVFLYILLGSVFQNLTPFDTKQMVVMGLYLMGVLFAMRILARLAMRFAFAASRTQLRVLVVGDGDNSLYIQNHLLNSDEKARLVTGVVNESGEGQGVVGTVYEIEETIRKHHVEEVIFTMPFHNISYLHTIHNHCSSQGVRFHWVPMVSRRTAQELELDYCGDIPLITLYETTFDARYAQIRKRFFDILFSAIALILLLPFLLFIAFVVKVTSRGSLFYTQEYLGEHNIPFKFYKFRTMYEDNQKRNHFTNVGLFLRRTNLDELLQIFNVLKGDMSLVGPRPIFIEEYSGDEVVAQEYLLKPGILGSAHLNAWRTSQVTEEQVQQRIAHDMIYTKQWTFSRDMRIVFKSIFSKSTRRCRFRMRSK